SKSKKVIQNAQWIKSHNHKVKPLTNKYLWQNRELLFFLCKEDYCVYLRDVTQSATLLASHRSGGFHRLMHSVAARTSYIKRFCKISTSSKARSKLRKAAGTLAATIKKNYRKIEENKETQKSKRIS